MFPSRLFIWPPFPSHQATPPPPSPHASGATPPPPSPHASGATRPPAGTLLQQCAGAVSTVSSYLPVACLNFSENMVSSPSRSTFLLSLPPTFLLLLLPHLSSPARTGLLVAGGEGAMTSAEVAFPLNVVLPSFKYQTFTHRCCWPGPKYKYTNRN